MLSSRLISRIRGIRPRYRNSASQASPGEEQLLESPLGEDGDDVLSALDVEVDAGDWSSAPPSLRKTCTTLRKVMTWERQR